MYYNVIFIANWYWLHGLHDIFILGLQNCSLVDKLLVPSFPLPVPQSSSKVDNKSYYSNEKGCGIVR